MVCRASAGHWRTVGAKQAHRSGLRPGHTFLEVAAPEDNILDVPDTMIEHGVSLGPVMEDGKLRGVVGLSNVFVTAAAAFFLVGNPAVA